MPIHLQPPRIVDFRLSEHRKTIIRDIFDLQDADLSTGDKLEAKKRMITKMGIWDTFVDRVFNDHRKERALAVIAEKVVCDMAASRLESGFPTAIENLEQRRLAAHAEFLECFAATTLNLYPRDDREVKDGRVWLTPSTTDEQLSHVLAISVPYDTAVRLFQAGGRYSECARIYSQMPADFLPHLKLHYKSCEASYWTRAGKHDEAVKAWEEVLTACDTCEAARANGTFADDELYADCYAQSFAPTKANASSQLQRSKWLASASGTDLSGGIWG